MSETAQQNIVSIQDGTVDEQEEVQGVVKYKNTVSFVEGKLHDTLTYVDEQLEQIETEVEDSATFSRSVYEAKKWLVEQKLQLLKHMTTLAGEQVRVTKKDAGTGEINDITDLFAKKGQ